MVGHPTFSSGSWGSPNSSLDTHIFKFTGLKGNGLNFMMFTFIRNANIFVLFLTWALVFIYCSMLVDLGKWVLIESRAEVFCVFLPWEILDTPHYFFWLWVWHGNFVWHDIFQKWQSTVTWCHPWAAQELFSQHHLSDRAKNFTQSKTKGQRYLLQL